jgi:3-oxoacyl-(acyl-carrier-protein) synthase
MSLGILGMGWVTPLGRGLAPVWQRFCSGETPRPGSLKNPYSGQTTPAFRIDDSCVADAARLPRLRRSSLISHLALAASLDAIADAGMQPDAIGDRMAVVFAAADGGVTYTRRFFAEVVESGTQAGSPILFPETVYNAPASHIAARVGVTGTTATLVGDAASSVHALAFANDLLDSDQADTCLVVAAEEIDWITAEACAVWNLTNRDGDGCEIPDTAATARRPPLADGAAALVVRRSRADDALIDAVHTGFSATARHRAAALLERVFRDLADGPAPALIVPSLAGSSLDALESSAIDAVFPGIHRLSMKPSLGEAFAASVLTQVIAARLWLRDRPSNAFPTSAIVSVMGLNGHVSGLRLTVDPPRH